MIYYEAKNLTYPHKAALSRSIKLHLLYIRQNSLSKVPQAKTITWKITDKNEAICF